MLIIDLWGLVGYECFGRVVLPHGLSETFNVTYSVLEKRGSGKLLIGLKFEGFFGVSE